FSVEAMFDWKDRGLLISGMTPRGVIEPSPPPDSREITREHAERLLFDRSEEHTSELQSLTNLVCRLLLEKKKKDRYAQYRGHTQLAARFNTTCFQHNQDHPSTPLRSLLCFIDNRPCHSAP